jgi:hypothetical protein
MVVIVSAWKGIVILTRKERGFGITEKSSGLDGYRALQDPSWGAKLGTQKQR